MTPLSERDDRLRDDLQSLRIERAPASTRTKQPRRGRKSRGTRIAIAIVALAVAALGVRLVRGSAVSVEVAQATAVEAGSLEPAPVLSGSGYVVTGDRYVSIGVRVAGRIDRYFIEEGQSVKKGDPLVQLDDRDYRAAVGRIEAGLALARANTELADSELRRGRALRKSGVISDQELDVLENKASVTHATIAQLEAELEVARVNLEYTTLRAPTDGVVLAKLKEVGEIAVPGGFAGSGDLVRIANLSDMRAEVDVNEADLERVRMGGNARVTPDAYPDRHYAARVVKLYPQVDRQKGTLKVEVKILDPDDKLLPDMSTRVTFLGERAAPGTAEAPPTVLVPARALQRDNDGSFVWIVEDGRVRRARVETSGESGDRVRVVSGLRGGETLVVGEITLKDGQRVTSAAKG
ncbi:efflux RND transporter periplasmic adaptor subunit [Candidatus Binatia bacterium]|jgi:RND family efflux transporter MFP subunit|nr:efflux RND transporter periplasmic adaptor subunit [Candidatus Binatia bacterium]